MEQVNVIFTTLDATVAAMHIAAGLARESGARLRLIDPRVVRYPLRSAGYALAAAPELSLAEHERQRVVIEAGMPVEVLVYVCGRLADAVRMALRAPALVVLGGRSSWWPTQIERWRRVLENEGHYVLFVDQRGGQC